MIPCLDQRRSAPESDLRKDGSEFTYSILNAAAGALSDKDLKSLDDDLTFYAQTGLIGVQMSRLMVLLRQNDVAEAA